MNTKPEPAPVMAAHGRRGLLRTGDALEPYIVQGRRLRVVCGDLVHWRRQVDSTDVVVTSAEPRRNSLARWHERRQRAETIAANIDCIAVVVATIPAIDFGLLDRFLCAAELMQCRALLVWNKSDLAEPDRGVTDVYGELGYPVVAVSALHRTSITGLLEHMSGSSSALVGQSGVGKSSLINAVVPDSGRTVGELSPGNDGGIHTTTAVTMHEIPGAAGFLLDTPGVRSFLPAIDPQWRIGDGFPEIRALATGCRFADCLHDREPGCEVTAAVATRRVAPHRYASYRQIARSAQR
ncbi:MAG: ribosome small subunit-dependent GTPase A [Gammaproteobacteria bacterium]|nr:ribosome small subunit-dependent GTPase A [Gammaproteobacteria bacterium]